MTDLNVCSFIFFFLHLTPSGDIQKVVTLSKRIVSTVDH